MGKPGQIDRFTGDQSLRSIERAAVTQFQIQAGAGLNLRQKRFQVFQFRTRQYGQRVGGLLPATDDQQGQA